MDINNKRKIKIAQIVTRLDWSGAPEIIEIICRHLDPSIYDLTLIYGFTCDPSVKTKEFLRGFSGKVVILPHLKRQISILEDLSVFVKLYILLRREKFDIVHTHTAKAGFIGRIAARMAKTPLVIHTPHGHDFYGYFGFLGSWFIVILERIAALFAHKIVVLTNIEKVDMLKYHICAAGKIEVIKSGMDFSEFEKLQVDLVKKKSEFHISSSGYLVGMIGRLETIKGFEYFIDSAKLILNLIPDTKFLIVGDGALRLTLIQRAKRLGIEDKIIFTGWREDVASIISILDVLVLASLNEAVGRVLLEAGISGKPAVATAVGGIPEIIKDNLTGILVPPRDAPAIAKAVIVLLQDARKRQAMGSAAREWVKHNFNQKQMISEIDQIYKELVER